MNLLVFDSGIGGFGVAREIRRLLPRAGMTYLADNACFPYGEQPDDFLCAHIVGLIGAAVARLNPDAVVIACNTASTIALAALRAAYKVRFIGCVPPVKPAAAASTTGHIGLLATPATIRRPYLQDLIARYAAGCTVHSLATPSLAAIAEGAFRGMAIDEAALAAAIAPLFHGDGALIDGIALGCTHYTFLLPSLRRLYPRLAFFDPALPVARQVQKVMQGSADRPPDNTAYFTGGVDQLDLTDFGFAEIRAWR